MMMYLHADWRLSPIRTLTLTLTLAHNPLTFYPRINACLLPFIIGPAYL